MDDLTTRVRELILKRNVLIHGDAEPPTRFAGEWVAIPREDFDKLAPRIARALEAAQHDRDELWCKVLIGTVDIDTNQRLLAAFNRHRDNENILRRALAALKEGP